MMGHNSEGISSKAVTGAKVRGMMTGTVNDKSGSGEGRGMVINPPPEIMFR